MINREKASATLSNNIQKVIEKLHLDLEYKNQYSMRGVAPCHEDSDNPTSFVYYPKTGKWYCYSHNCHTLYGSDLIGLIMAVYRIDQIKALKKAQEIIQSEHMKICNSPPRHFSKNINYWTQHLLQDKFDIECLGKRYCAASYGRKRGIDPLIFNQHQIFLTKTSKLKFRIIVPIKNVSGKIVGFSGRSINDKYQPKWLHYRFKKSINMFNINNITPDEPLILVEGIWDALKIIQSGYRNVCCIFGCHLTTGQCDLIVNVGVTEVIMGLDNDQAGLTALDKNAQMLKRQLLTVHNISPPKSKKDFGECSNNDIIDAIKEQVKL